MAEIGGRCVKAKRQQLIFPRAKRLLDLGCGNGRFLARYAPYFDEVIGLEPNEHRLRTAMDTLARTGIRHVQGINARFEDFPTNMGLFDVILCSHVIQHVQTSTLHDIMQKIHASLTPGGSVILLTAFSQQQNDTYRKWGGTGSPPFISDEAIDPNEFDRLLSDGFEQNVLPMRCFGHKSLRALLPSCTLTQRRYFHALHPANATDKVIFRDAWINAPLARGRHGIDVLLTFCKPA